MERYKNLPCQMTLNQLQQVKHFWTSWNLSDGKNLCSMHDDNIICSIIFVLATLPELAEVEPVSPPESRTIDKELHEKNIIHGNVYNIMLHECWVCIFPLSFL